MTTQSIIKKAAEIIMQGGLVAFPTETVYGLGANAFDNDACLRIYKTKGRPSNNPLIVHVASPEQAKELASFNDDATKLATLWPGPLTLVLQKKPSKLAPCVTANLDTVAIRIPAHEIALELIKQSGVPIAAPSANKSGRLSPTSGRHVATNFTEEEVFIIDTKETSKYGLESTIIDLSTDVPTILRFGFITPALIEEILGKKVAIATISSEIKAPGMMHSHYAPKTPIRLNAKELNPGEVGLNFGDSKLDSPGTLNLSTKGDLAEAASNLFDYLHKLDDYAQKNKITRIAIATIPDNSIGLAINDRLKRGAG